VHIIEVADLLNKGKNIETVDQYLKDLDGKYVSKMSAFGIPEGYSVFVPFCYLAVIVAVSPDDNNVDGSYITVPILESKLMMNTTELVRAEVQGYLIKSMSRKLNFFAMSKKKSRLRVGSVAGHRGKP
jgi:hypothetical protein